MQLPPNIKLCYSSGQLNNDDMSRKKKGKCKEGEIEELKEASKENRLSTLDIFAGCGGLSEGLEQSGMLSFNIKSRFIFLCKRNLIWVLCLQASVPPNGLLSMKRLLEMHSDLIILSLWYS